MTEIEEVLRAVRVTTTSPSVSELRRELAIGDRRRDRSSRLRVLAVGAVAAAAATLIAGILLTTSDTDQLVDTGPATTAPTPMTVPPAPAPLVSTPGDGDEWTALLPDEEWSIELFRSEPVLWVHDRAKNGLRLGTDDPFGPTLLASFNPGLDTRDYIDGPLRFIERDTPAGLTVRIGYDNEPQSLTAIFIVEGGSIAASTTGLDEDQMLRAIDAITTNGASITVDPTAALPADLAPEPAPEVPTSYWRTTVHFRRSGGPRVTMDIWPVEAFDRAVVGHRLRTPVEPISVVGGRGEAFGGDGISPEIVLITAERAYELRTDAIRLADGSTPEDELRRLAAALRPATGAELMARTDGALDRATVLNDWIEATPLPPSAEVAWLWSGPPLGDLRTAAGRVHDVLTCAWVAEWITTGEPAALDAMLGNGRWPTTLLASEMGGLPMLGLTAGDREMVEARAASDEAARAATSLRWWCNDYLDLPDL